MVFSEMENFSEGKKKKVSQKGKLERKETKNKIKQ